jgi:hypothetical protein
MGRASFITLATVKVGLFGAAADLEVLRFAIKASHSQSCSIGNTYIDCCIKIDIFF